MRSRRWSSHLDGLRPERKFVMVFTEGWPLYPRRPGSGARDRRPRARPAIRSAPIRAPAACGGPARPDPQTGSQTTEACDRQRTMLAYSDHEMEFRELLQRANRANVSFYPIDARGLVVFDTPIEWGVPPSVDRGVAAQSL